MVVSHLNRYILLVTLLGWRRNTYKIDQASSASRDPRKLASVRFAIFIGVPGP